MKKLAIMFVIAGMSLLGLSSFAKADPPDPTPGFDPPPPGPMVTLCHVAGLASDPANLITLTINENAAFGGQGGHFDEQGTPLAGHEQDYLGPCNPSPTGTPSPTTPPPPVDVCPNIEGNQAEVPDGYKIDKDGNCVPIEKEECPEDRTGNNTPSPCPTTPPPTTPPPTTPPPTTPPPTTPPPTTPPPTTPPPTEPPPTEPPPTEPPVEEPEPNDECPNLQGIQEEVPAGFHKRDGDCYPNNPPVEPPVGLAFTGARENVMIGIAGFLVLAGLAMSGIGLVLRRRA